MISKTRKLLSVLAAATLVIGTAACGGGGGRTQTTGGNEGGTAESTTAPVTTEDPNKAFDTEADYESMANIEEVDTKNEEGAGKNYVSGQTAGTIRALCYYDFKNISPEREILDLYATRFGGTVETEFSGVTSENYMEKLGVLVAAGDSPDIVRYEWTFLPGEAIKGTFMALDDWLDKDAPVWSAMTDIIEKHSFNGKHYYFPQNMIPNYGVTYSTACIEEIGARDPMDLYFEGEWTWDEFESDMQKWMALSPDKIGLAKGESTAIHLAATTGVPAIEFTGSAINNNMRTPEVIKTMQFVEKITKEGYVFEGWRSPEEGFVDGKLLFYIMPTEWAITECQTKHFKNNLEGEVRSVPIPRDPDSDQYYLLGNSYGYLVPAGAKNVQGAVSWILAGRIYKNDPEVVAEEREELMYNGPYYYPKCTNSDCKHVFDSERDVEDAVCPECGTPRKAKFKVTYTEQQMQVIDDMSDPSKFNFVFDCHRGFGDDLCTAIKDCFDSPFSPLSLAEGETYTHMLEEQYNVIETSLDEYRARLQ